MPGVDHPDDVGTFVMGEEPAGAGAPGGGNPPPAPKPKKIDVALESLEALGGPEGTSTGAAREWASRVMGRDLTAQDVSHGRAKLRKRLAGQPPADSPDGPRPPPLKDALTDLARRHGGFRAVEAALYEAKEDLRRLLGDDEE